MKERFYILILMIFSFECCTNPQRVDILSDVVLIDGESKSRIRNEFENWKKEQIRNREFFADDSCNTGYYVLMDSLGKESVTGVGFPDTSEIKFRYAELNNDGKLDALIYFRPEQCDGGNAMMFARCEILVLSKKSEYLLIDDYFDKMISNKKGFYHWDSVSTNKIWGTYFEYGEDDGRCCPSIQEAVDIQFDSTNMLKKSE